MKNCMIIVGQFGNSDHSEYLLRGSRYGQRTREGWGETTTTLHKEDVHGEIKRNYVHIM